MEISKKTLDQHIQDPDVWGNPQREECLECHDDDCNCSDCELDRAEAYYEGMMDTYD